MQSASSTIWTRLTETISDDDNHYATSTIVYTNVPGLYLLVVL